MTYSIQAYKVGQNSLPASVAYQATMSQEWDIYTFYIFVLRDRDRTILINTGLADPPTDINTIWWRLGGERASAVVAEQERVPNVLAAAGVDPAKVDKLIITPLVSYATGNISMFPNAQICILRSGWSDYFTPRQRDYNDARRYVDIPRDQVIHLVTDAWPRVRLLADEDEIAPGIQCWKAGSHHRSSMAIKIATPRGTVIYSDSFFFYKNYEQRIPVGVCEDVFEAFATYDRVAREADVVLPGFDVEILERFPGGKIA